MLQLRQQQEQRWAEWKSLWGQRTQWGNGTDDETGEEAEGSLRLQGRDFSPDRRSAHVVGFRPPQVTSRVVQRTGATLSLTMNSPETIAFKITRYLMKPHFLLNASFSLYITLII